jgi:hypothetical protein
MMWSCTAMPSGLAMSAIVCVIWMSARDGVGSPDGWLWMMLSIQYIYLKNNKYIPIQ